MAGVPLTTVIADIAKAAREHTPRGITVFVGHSFGGRILERVVGQAIVAQSAIDRTVRQNC
jgi:predicted alpha/beta hydrolase